jgi:chromosome segregation ATPase
MGFANLAAIISMAGMLVMLMLRLDRRIDRVEDRFDRVEDRFDRVEERLQRLEQGQARLEGEMVIIREALFARPAAGD